MELAEIAETAGEEYINPSIFNLCSVLTDSACIKLFEYTLHITDIEDIIPEGFIHLHTKNVRPVHTFSADSFNRDANNRYLVSLL